MDNSRPRIFLHVTTVKQCRRCSFWKDFFKFNGLGSCSLPAINASSVKRVTAYDSGCNGFNGSTQITLQRLWRSTNGDNFD